MQMMADLIERGFEDQLVVAQDIGKKHYMRRYGGMGYDHVIERVMPRMKKFMGVSQRAIDKALVETPRRLLTRAGDG
jgi:phosphotriesterase-related protein